MPIGKRAAAEFFGTFWLVFGGCGAAVLAAGVPNVGIGYAGVALAFGLTVLTMAFAIGHISGCHLNPAISLGLVVGKRFPVSDLLPYVVAQVAGAIAAAGVLYVIASGVTGFDVHSGFASNGYAEHSPRRLQSARLPGGRSRIDGVLPLRDHGLDRQSSSEGICPDCHRSLPDPDSPGRHPGHESVRESRAQHGSRDFRRRLGTAAVVAVLGGAAGRRSPGRWRL